MTYPEEAVVWVMSSIFVMGEFGTRTGYGIPVVSYSEYAYVNSSSLLGWLRGSAPYLHKPAAGLWRYGDRRHVATGCTALVYTNVTGIVPAKR